MRGYILLLLFLLPALQSNAQNHAYIIQAVKFSGLEKNKESYLNLFIQQSAGDTLNEQIIDEDLEQLNRRTGIAKSTVRIDTINSKSVIVEYLIQEQRTLIPQFGIGGIKNNFWWQIGGAEYNLGGKEQTLLVTYLHNDGKPNAKVFYQNNWINGKPWGFGTDISRSASIEPLYFPEAAVDFEYTNTGIGIFGNRNFGYNNQLSLGVNYFQETYAKQNINPNEITPGPNNLTENKLLFKINYGFNKVGYDYFYRWGLAWNLLGQSVLTINNDIPFFSITFEGKNYWKPYPTGNLAIRLRMALASNGESPFAPFVLDSRVNIRGVGNRVDRGTAQFVLNTEFRQSLFHAPRWAGQIVVFADSGTWRNPGGALKDLFDKNQFRQFVGIGIRIIDKKVFRSVFRFDYGFDLWNTQQNGPVLGIGQYF